MDEINILILFKLNLSFFLFGGGGGAGGWRVINMITHLTLRVNLQNVHLKLCLKLMLFGIVLIVNFTSRIVYHIKLISSLNRMSDAI